MLSTSLSLSPTSAVRRIGDLVTSNLHVAREAPISSVARLFEQNPELDALAVLGGPRARFLSRARFFLQLGRRFGYSLFENRPVELLAEEGSTVEAESEPLEVITLALQRESARVYDDILVLEDGRYLGMVSMRSLLAHHKDLLVASLTEPAVRGGPPGTLPGGRDALHRASRPGQAAGALHAPGPAGAGLRHRPRVAAPRAPQPAFERGEVHRSGPDTPGGGSAEAAAHLVRAGHGHRPRRGGPAAALLPLHPARLQPAQAPAGTGLGLAIVKGLLETLGGGISVQSRPGHGSTFTVVVEELQRLAPEEVL